MQHKDFITYPLKHILEEATFNLASQNWSIETYPLIEHYFISLYLKLSGASEQKLKCVCWDMATEDYEYRYQTFSQNKLGECSCYEEKKKIVNDIYKQIKKRKLDFNLNTEIDRDEIIKTVKKVIKDFYDFSGVEVIWSHEYEEFYNYIDTIDTRYFLVNKQTENKDEIILFQKRKDDKQHITSDDLYEIFDLAYKHRNRCAHNTLSYQENQIPLNKYVSDDYKYENYFFRYALLVLIDEIVIALYKKYLEVI